ncbi:unnamed protein product [Penicillium bialowiezense]
MQEYRRILTTILFLLICAAADTSSDASDSSLLNMVPDCAKDCVDSFIKSEYTPEECTAPSNVKCLCRNKTQDGYTLGEAALSCVLSLCSKEVIADSKAYHICDSVSGAIPKTHKTITATVFSDMSTTMAGDASTTADSTTTSSAMASQSTSEAPLTASTASPASTSTLISTTSTSASTTSSETSENTSITSTTSYDTTSSSFRAEPTSSAGQDPLASSGASEDTTKKGDGSISPGAVIGISVASGVAGLFLVVVAVVFCCKRWRKKHRNRDQSDPHHFEIGGAMSEPVDFTKPMPRLPTPSSGPSSLHDRTNEHESSQQYRVAQLMGSAAKVQSASPYSPHLATISHGHQSKRSREERIGFAISSDSDWEASPRTQSSQHSVARLLPDPTAGLYPKPLKWTHRPVSGETLFEEDESQQTVAMMRENTPRLGAQPRLAGLPPNPRAFIETPEGFKRRSGPRTLASPFNPNIAYRASSSESSAAPDNAPDGPYNTSSHLGSAHAQAQPKQSSLHPNTEIVSCPRIVRAEDIKRVEIRSSPRQPEVVAPYCPEDLWLERGRNDNRESQGELPYPSDVHPGAVDYPNSPKKKATNRVSPTSRNLTPSRRGDDLILRVD